MSTDSRSEAKRDRPMVYQFRIEGCPGRQWTAWFEGMAVTLEDNDATVVTAVADKSALHGLLKKVRNLGPPPASGVRVELDRSDAPHNEQSERLVLNRVG